MGKKATAKSGNKAQGPPSSQTQPSKKKVDVRADLVEKLKKHEIEILGLRASCFDNLLQHGTVEALKAASLQKEDELKTLRAQQKELEAPTEQEPSDKVIDSHGYAKNEVPTAQAETKPKAKAEIKPAAKADTPAKASSIQTKEVKDDVSKEVNVQGLRLKVESTEEDEDDNDASVETTLEMLFSFEKGHRVKVKFEYTNEPHDYMDYEEKFETGYSATHCETGALRVELQYRGEAKQSMVSDAIRGLVMVSEDGNKKGPWKVASASSEWLPYNNDNRHDNAHDLTEAEVSTQ